VNLVSRLLRAPLRLLPRDATVRVLGGELRGSKWIAGAATHGCWLGTYEPEAQRVFRDAVREGDVVYDVGANVGFFTLVAAKHAGASGTVYAFEPVARNLAYLRKHVALNRASTVRILELALSSEPGVARFASGANASMGRLAAEGDVEVRVETIDRLVAAGDSAPPRFIKMDVEGAEHDVLTGAAATFARHRPALLLSTHGYEIHERCSALLRAWGYELRLLRDGALDGQYTLLAMPAETAAPTTRN
jgi:FkbM family methyltransferase